MNQRRIINQDPEQKQRFDFILAVSSLRSLKDMKVTLSLIQSACSYALEGNNRVSASDISNRAMTEYGIEATPSYTGQVFAKLGIISVTSHGKNRFVLAYDQLEKIHKQLSVEIEERSNKLESTIESFSYLPKRIDELGQKIAEIRKQLETSRTLATQISQAEQNLPNIMQLKAKYASIKEQADRATDIEKVVTSLTQKAKKLPSLEEKQKALQESISEYEKADADLIAQEQELTRKSEALAKREEALAGRTVKLQTRNGLVELVELQEAIEKTKKELDQVLRQLGEKRTLLDKMLGKNRQRE